MGATSQDKAMDRENDQGSFRVSVTAVIALALVIGTLYLPLFL
jgi:hypothetical protein